MLLAGLILKKTLKNLKKSSKICITSSILIVLFINLVALAFLATPLANAPAVSSFPTLGDEKVALDYNTSYWDSARGGPHNLDILELNKDGHRYWGYYGTADHASVGLAFSEDLENWTRYSLSTPLIDGFGWPTVGVQDGVINMFYIHGGILNGVYRATSPVTDGYIFTEQELAASGNGEHDPFLWHNPNDGEWWLLTAENGNTIGARHASNLTDIVSAPHIVFRIDGSMGVLAAPGIFYRNNTYYLTTESNPGGVWVVRAFYSDVLGPNCFDGACESPNSPILPDDDACGFPHLKNDYVYYYYSHRSGGPWDVRFKVSIEELPPPPPPPPPVPPSADWYNMQWTERKPIAINNTPPVSNPNGVWSDKALMPAARADASIAIVNGKIYLFGGYGPGSPTNVRNETFVYDPVADSWTQKASMASNHSYAATACAVGTKAYVFGGIDSSNNWDGYKTLDIYDTVADSWSVGSDFPIAIGMHSASAITYNGKIYVMGGWRDGDTSGNITIYDPETDTYDTSKAPMPTPRRFFSLSEVNGVLYAIGGGGPSGSYLNTNEAYDITLNTWTTKKSMPISRWGLAREDAALDGKIYISHGMTDTFFATACVYDTSTDTWQLLPSASHPRDGHNCAIINGTLYVVAGRDGSGALPYNEQFDPVAHPSTPADLVDYQVRINVAYASSMKTDFSDLRFTDTDGTTLISYWIQNYTASNSAIFWVKVPRIPTSSLKWIWMYYGNSQASSTSNGENTFDLFDDFNVLDTSKWSIKGSPRVEGGALVLDTTGSITSIASFGSGHAIETQAYIGGETSTNHWLGFCASDMTGPFTLFERGGGGSFSAYTYPNAQTTAVSESFLDSYHWYSITYVSGAEKYYVDDSSVATHSQILGSMPVEFRVYSGTATTKSLWVAIRKYSSPEPLTIFGNEQTNETSLYLSPSAIKKSSLEVGSSFKVNVTIQNVIALSGFDFNITWDSNLLTFNKSYYNDTLDTMWGSGKWFAAIYQNGPGYCRLVALSTANSFNTTQSQTIFTLELTVNGPTPPEETSIHFAIHKISDSKAEPIAHLIQDGDYIYVEAPTLEMDPTARVCRTIDEIFILKVNVSDTDNVTGFAFEIHYNTTLLDYVNVSWNAWGSGTINTDEVLGIINGSTSGVPITGTQNLLTLQFKASFYHVWKIASGWTNNLTNSIFFQWANLSYFSGPDLQYTKGGPTQIIVGPDFAYTFSPILGDVNNNGVVDVLDLRTVAIYHMVRQGDPNWTEASTYDLNGDGVVDIFDLRTAASNFGYTYAP